MCVCERERERRVKLQVLVTTSFLQPLPYLVTPQVSENCQLMSSFLLVVSLLQTTQIISDISFIADHVRYASSNETKIV